MGFFAEFCIIKKLCLVDNWRIDDEEAIGNVRMDANSKRAMHFIVLIKQYQELVSAMCDAGNFLGRRAEITQEHGEGDLSEWNERKGDVLYQLADYYEKTVLTVKCLLKKLIETSDKRLTMIINSEDVMVLHSPFQKIL